jgi:F-box-like
MKEVATIFGLTEKVTVSALAQPLASLLEHPTFVPIQEHIGMATNIPYEVLENISELLDRDTLAKACRVSKAFYDAAARVLYRSFLLNPWDPRAQVGV